MSKRLLLLADYTEDSDKCSKIIAKTPKWTKALESNQFLLTFADLLDSLWPNLIFDGDDFIY